MTPKKIVYLFGAGSTRGEFSLSKAEAKILMIDLAKHAFDSSKEIGGAYSNFVEKFAMDPEEQDIEWLISLFETGGSLDAEMNKIADELKKLYRTCLMERINAMNVLPIITISLLHLYLKYGEYIGEMGEELLGILTTNNDSLIEKAYCNEQAYDGVNCGYPFSSAQYKLLKNVPPLLKLHGSFNWNIEGKNLEIDDKYENDNEGNGWVTPSVFKKPEEAPVFNKIWESARSLLLKCDVLRVVGCKMRNEDFQLLSLIFSSQVSLMRQKKKIFNIELIMPEKDAVGNTDTVIERLPFLYGLKKPSDSIFYSPEPDPDKNENSYYYWIKQVVDHIEIKNVEIKDDVLIMEKLLRRKFVNEI